MPFTFSHPALVLPLFKISRNWLSLTGLVVGSITPDFEYSMGMGMGMHSSISHTLGGLFWFDLPLGLFLTFVFHNIIRNSFYENLPQTVKQRVLIYKSFNWNAYFKERWLIVILSVLIGAASHLLWDAFTHNRAFFVVLFPVLNTSIEVMGEVVPVYRVLQHISTLIGALVIGLAIFNLPLANKTIDQSWSRYWLVVSGIASIIIILRLPVGIEQNFFEQTVVIFISAFLIGLTAASSLVKRKKVKVFE